MQNYNFFLEPQNVSTFFTRIYRIIGKSDKKGKRIHLIFLIASAIMCLQLTSDKSDKSVSFSLINSQYYIIALLLLITLQELNPSSLSMGIKTLCPKIDKQCLPTSIYLNDICVKTLFIIYFF